RTTGVLAVLYLLFNEGYSASSGDALIRAGLCDEAIRLARLLRRLLPDEPGADALLGLMLGPPPRPGLGDEAIRLARLLRRLLPDEPEADALLALMLVQHSRRDARVDSAGDL